MSIPNEKDNFLLTNIDNYYDTYTSTKEEVVECFMTIIYDFLSHCERTIYISDNNYLYYVIENGINILYYIFSFVYMYSKNLEMTKQYTEKGYYIYCEFIGKIGDNNHKYLQLNSKDTTLFVLKKTIFEINNTYTRNFTLNADETDYINHIKNTNELYLNFVKSFLKINNFLSVLKTDKNTNRTIQLFPLHLLNTIKISILKNGVNHPSLLHKTIINNYDKGTPKDYIIEIIQIIGFEKEASLFNEDGKGNTTTIADFYDSISNYFNSLLIA